MDAPIVEEHPHAPCAPGLSCPSQVSNRKAYTTQGDVPNPSRRMGQQRPRGVRAVRHDEVALRVRRLGVAPAGTRLHRRLWYNFNVLILWALFEGWSCDCVLGSMGSQGLHCPYALRLSVSHAIREQVNIAGIRSHVGRENTKRNLLCAVREPGDHDV